MTSERLTFSFALNAVLESAEARVEMWDHRAMNYLDFDDLEAMRALCESDPDEAQDIAVLLGSAIQTLRAYQPRAKHQIRGAYLREYRDKDGGLVEEYWESHPVDVLNRVGFELGKPDKWAIYRWQEPGPNGIRVQDFVEDHDDLIDAVEALERLEWRE